MGKQIAEDGNAAVGSQGHQRQGEVIIAGIEGESITKFQQVLMNEAKIGTGFLKADDIINFGKFPAALHIDGHPGTGRNIIDDDPGAVWRMPAARNATVSPWACIYCNKG